MKNKIPPKLKSVVMTLLEFFVFWGASILPIIIGGVCLKLKGNEYFPSVYNLFIKDPVFVYTSTMTAPFFFMLVPLIFNKKVSGPFFPSIALFFSIATLVVSIALYVYALINSITNPESITFKNGLSIVCYVVACIIWIYSIYLNRKPEIDFEEKQKSNQSKLNSAINKYFEV